MARDRRPDPDRITDLRRYKRAREAEARRAQRPARSRESLLGSNPRAPLILAAIVVLMLAMWLGPRLLALLP